MKKTKISNLIKQFFCYVAGLLTIALGINVSKLSALGISPVSSIPRALELKWGFTLGTTTMIIYCVLVLLQIVILRRKFKLINLLGIALTFVFSWMIDLLGTDQKAFGHLLDRIGFPAPHNYALKLVYLAVSVIIIGIGVFLYLRPKWIPMPAEGLAGAISTVSGKAFGDCKTFVDCAMITAALIIQFVFLGGFKSFTGDNVVVREGTIVAAICVGQIVKLLTKPFGKKLDLWFRKGETKKDNT